MNWTRQIRQSCQTKSLTFLKYLNDILNKLGKQKIKELPKPRFNKAISTVRNKTSLFCVFKHSPIHKICHRFFFSFTHAQTNWKLLNSNTSNTKSKNIFHFRFIWKSKKKKSFDYVKSTHDSGSFLIDIMLSHASECLQSFPSLSKCLLLQTKHRSFFFSLQFHNKHKQKNVTTSLNQRVYAVYTKRHFGYGLWLKYNCAWFCACNMPISECHVTF